MGDDRMNKTIHISLMDMAVGFRIVCNQPKLGLEKEVTTDHQMVFYKGELIFESYKWATVLP